MANRSAATWSNPGQAPAGRLMPARAWKTLAVLTGLAVCVGAITYAVLWLTPPKAPRLMVATADCADNPLVPTNAGTATAAQGFIDLNRFTGRGRLRPDNAPYRLTRGEAGNLLTKLSTLHEPVVVAVFAANGGCDASGPFLIPDDASPEPSERVRVKAILEAVAKLPADTRKLIVFDAAGATSAPVLGQFHNDFARGVQSLDADIAAIPNLLVFVSAGADQRSWRSPEWGESAFLHHLRIGLGGAADANSDSRLSADELIEYATRRTRQWARDQRGASQVPELFPTSDGRHRATGTALGIVEKHTDVDPQPTPFTAPPSEWEDGWKAFVAFDKATPHPTTYSPLRWRQYTEWLLRADRLLAEGDNAGAMNALSRASQLVPLINADRAIVVSPQTLALPSALGESSTRSDALGPVIGKVALASDADRPAEWEKAKKEGDRPALGRALVKWVADDPFARLKFAPPVVALITEGFNVVPAELHFLTMVARDLPTHPASAAVWPLLQRVLRLRVTAEETAIGAQGEAVRPWIADRITAADTNRRVAEDLLFSGSASGWFTANTCAQFAEWLYADAANTADVIRTARTTWQTAIPRLNGLTEWLAAGERPKDLPDRMTREERLNMARAMWADVHRLAERSEAPPVTDRVASLKSLTESVAARVAEVQKLHRDAVVHLLDEKNRPNSESRTQLLTWWHAADIALSVPFADYRDEKRPSKREQLLVELRHVSRQLHVLDRTRSEPLAEPTTDEVRERAFDAARRRGLLHLSALGRAAFERAAGDGYERTAFQLDQFSRQADAQAELIAGEERFASAVRQLAGHIPTEDNSLPVADLLARSSLIPPQSDPAVRLRKLRAEQLLMWQANRTQDDRWSGGDSAKPYYRRAADTLRDDARKLANRPAEQPTPATNFPLNVLDLPDITVTDELNPRAVFDVKSASAAVNGVVVYRGAEAAFARATAGPLAPMELLIPPRSGPPPTVPAVERSVLALHGYFRGEKVEAKVNVARHPLPHTTAARRPADNTVSVAVRTNSDLRAKLGTGTGHLHFVIDCSGSMGTPDNPATRPEFLDACDRLESVLKQVPKGVTVAVSAFGQRTPAAKSPEDTFAPVRAADLWNGSGDVKAVMDQLRALEPWDKSAVVQSVLQARKAIGDVAGTRAVILFSDCADNRFTDPEVNPKKVAVKDALRAAFGDGCPLHVVAFTAEKAADAVREQFRSVTTFKPAGLFLTPEQTDKLVEWIRTATAPQVRLQVLTGRDSTDLTAGTDTADNWLSPLLKAGRVEIKLLAPEVSQPVKLEAGERLLVELTADKYGPRFTRPNFATDVPAVARLKADEWAVAVPRQRLTDAGGLELVALADRKSKIEATEFSPARVADVWFELAPSTASAVAVKWTNTTGWPCPAWDVSCPAWPVDGGKATVPTLTAWWSDQGQFAAAGSWTTPTDKPLSAAAPFTASTTVGDVTVNGLSVETHDGRTCLVVRLTHPAGKTVVPRLKDATPDGSEVRVYRDANRVTALFWWSDATAMKAVRGLEFVAIDDAKKQATQKRTFAVLPQLPQPAIGTPAPTPAPR